MIKHGMAVIKGATGPKFSHSAPMSDTNPAPIARTPFQNVEMEKVAEIHSLGNAYCSLCWQTYQASKVEKRIEVDMPPNKRPVKSHQKLGLILVTQQNV